LVGTGGLSYEDAPQVSGMAIGTIRSRISRARVSLQAILQNAAFRRDGAEAGQAIGAFLSGLA
jgi:RNA polymerase sigma-70 factor (ECF subfamily)